MGVEYFTKLNEMERRSISRNDFNTEHTFNINFYCNNNLYVHVNKILLFLQLKRLQGKSSMGKVRVLHVCNTPLAISEVVSLLKNPPEDVLSTLPPAMAWLEEVLMPKVGEIYFYRNDSETRNGMICII